MDLSAFDAKPDQRRTASKWNKILDAHTAEDIDALTARLDVLLDDMDYTQPQIARMVTAATGVDVKYSTVGDWRRSRPWHR